MLIFGPYLTFAQLFLLMTVILNTSGITFCVPALCLSEPIKAEVITEVIFYSIILPTSLKF